MRENLYINAMDKSELIESLKNTTGNAIDIVSNYVTKSLAHTPDRTDLLIFALLGCVVLIFCYFDVVKKKLKALKDIIK
jgi:hypothetical protein